MILTALASTASYRRRHGVRLEVSTVIKRSLTDGLQIINKSFPYAHRAPLSTLLTLEEALSSGDEPTFLDSLPLLFCSWKLFLLSVPCFPFFCFPCYVLLRPSFFFAKLLICVLKIRNARGLARL